MTVAATLPIAATIAAENLYTLWAANTLKTKATSFWQSLVAVFPDQDVTSHPVSNWLILIAALADQMPATSVPYGNLNTMIDYVYRICFVTSGLNTQTPKQVTNTQAAALLAAYNLQFS